jgi:hypothetical protein
VNRYLVTVRGIAEQTLVVHADSRSEAREKARDADFDDALGYPDWIRNTDGTWARWPTREPVDDTGPVGEADRAIP